MSSSSIIKGNASSSDNPLAFPLYSNSNSLSYPNSQSPTKAYASEPSSNSIYSNNNKYFDTDRYLKTNQFNSASTQEFSNNTNSLSQFESASGGLNFSMANRQQQRTPSQSDIRYDVDFKTKQAYRSALDQQVIEKEMNKLEQQRANKKSELETLSQYPFGRRTDPNSYIMNENRYSQPVGNTGAFRSPFYREEPSTAKLDKNSIIEKPNSLSADIPPYDPIKHRNGFHQGYTYDPWGKPGGGAPLIDPNTGRIYTKITGQVAYDQKGMSLEERAKISKVRPYTLEEQKYDMNIEKERKRYENEMYKQRAGDVATWITDLEGMRRNNMSHGAHLPITNVTRDKINLESVRRSQDEKAKQYHEQLGAQLEEKNREKKLFKLKDDVAGIEHTRNWNEWWGKPGGGAPNQERRRRDLAEVLQSPREKMFSGTATSLPMPASSPTLAKSNTKTSIKSNHANLYDNVTLMKL